MSQGEDLSRDLEGVPSLHLSLSKSSKPFLILVFTNSRSRCISCFSYLLNVCKADFTCTDRLGRTIGHVIIQNKAEECLDQIQLKLSDLFCQDLNGENLIDYIYIYNSAGCFEKLCKIFKVNVLLNELKDKGIGLIEKCIK
jgi:hypothetical protein